MTLQADELNSFEFLSPEVADRTIPQLARRILAAIEARSSETAPIYLKHGQQPSSVAA
ncbi:hypothetical protein ABT186_39500 [Streptomyces sp. NPDC001634]|uniref:hypothetical protein n=1 Tax=Streptomyces sp. NPDC001634 TaxID=3154390 RepID=UPI0033247958